jgi:PKD repeat protein
MLKFLSILLAAFWLAAFSLLATAETIDVSVVDNRFTPNDITINVGDTVRWTNATGGAAHDVTSDDGKFTPSVTASSFTFSRTFNSVDEILYHCTVHSSPGQNRNSRMNGRVVVQAAAMAAPTANFTSDCTDLNCSFADQSSDTDGNIASWSWDFDDDAISSQQNPNHSFAAAGTYGVELEVTDNDGQSDSITKNVNVTEPAAPPFLINPAISDAWFFPDTSGQGFFIIVWEDSKLIFLSWFTYETERPPEDVTAILGEPGHRWLTALGPYDGDTALLDVFLSSGMIFDSDDPVVDTAQLEGATIEIIWSDCKTGILKYDIPSLGLVGEIPIQRIVEDNVPACLAAQP